MRENLQDIHSVPYGNKYLRSKLFEHYEDSLFVAEGEGLPDIVTFRHKTGRILRDYFNMPNKEDEEAHKKVIIETAAKFIKSDIKTSITCSKDKHPKSAEMQLESALKYIPSSLHFMLNIFWLERTSLVKKQVLGKQLFKLCVQGV